MLDREGLARLWHERAQLTRVEIFGAAEESTRPTSMPSQVDVCVPGMVGRTYGARGVVIASVNPAGGRDGFTPTSGDDELYRAAGKIRESANVDLFEKLNRAFEIGMPSWGAQWRVVNRILKAIQQPLSNIGYPYLVPFRSRGDAGTSLRQEVFDRGYTTGFRNILSCLLPAYLIAVDRPSERACLRARKELGLDCEIIYFTRKRDAHAEQAAVLAELSSKFS